MKETPLSTCEREFILKAIAEKKRLDGRQAFDYRTTKISFGVDRGCCQVQLGETRVLAQVSCEVVEPKLHRPTDGILYVNVELSPMASPSFEAGRLSEKGVEMNRLLERCLKESKCLDLESLCIVAKKKVWQIRLDLHVLNHDGNLIDCASIAGIASLAHFKRPDVTVSGEDVTIHTVAEKDPIPLSVHHMPICTSFAFFEHGKYLLIDPTEKEERVMNGKMVIGMNKHREICTLQMTGDMLLLKEQVMRCSNIAVVKVTALTKLINEALANDTKARAEGQKFGFAISEQTERITANYRGAERVAVEKLKEELGKEEEDESSSSDDMDMGEGGTEESESTEMEVVIMGPGTAAIGSGGAAIGSGGASTWTVSDDEMDEVQIVQETKKGKQKGKGSQEVITLDSDDSEEEVVVMTNQEDLSYSKKSSEKKKGNR